MQYFLLTGMSGAGKTTAIRYMEDLGGFCVDNLPPMMMLKFIEACETSSLSNSFAAFAIDVRSGQFFDAKGISKLIKETRQLGHTINTIFLDSTDEALVSRYKETRREHPLSGDHVTLVEAIAEEREKLSPLRETADFVVDTTQMKAKALQKQLQAILTNGSDPKVSLRVEVVSFGFKRGIPKEADLVFDVRFLPNPFYIDTLCRHCGLDGDVRDFVMNHPVTQEFMVKTTDMLSFLLPHYLEEGKHRLVIAVGCTGGAHRSVAIAAAIGEFLSEHGYKVDVTHRDLDIEQARWKVTEGKDE